MVIFHSYVNVYQRVTSTQQTISKNGAPLAQDGPRLHMAIAIGPRQGVNPGRRHVHLRATLATSGLPPSGWWMVDPKILPLW